MNKMNINGVNYSSANNLTIINGKVIVDGESIIINDKVITIKIEGNIKELKVDNCAKIDVIGDVTDINTMSGDVDIKGNVNGYVKTMSGDVDISGSVSGNIKTMSGDIKHR